MGAGQDKEECTVLQQHAWTEEAAEGSVKSMASYVAGSLAPWQF